MTLREPGAIERKNVMNSMGEFSAQLRGREPLVGYWSMLDSAVSIERLARVGYDYVCIDAQHGFGGYHGLVHGLIAMSGITGTVGLVRVPENSQTEISRALDAGACGVIVPLVDDASAALRAAKACRYPPRGTRSYGPIRSEVGQHSDTLERDRDVLCLAMIETATGLENVEEISRAEGVDGIYVGPSDLSLALGARYPGDERIAGVFEDALRRVVKAAEDAGVAAGIHCPSGEIAARRLREGFTFASVASDIVHLEQSAAAHLAAVRGVAGSS